MKKNTTRDLIDALRPNLPELAKWVGVSTWAAQNWRQGTYKPTPKKRAALVKATRQHCKELLALAHRLEREGATTRRK
jgi:hypothetical protein